MKALYYSITFVLLLSTSVCCSGQNDGDSKKWSIVLPLRFTHLQNNNTMLSGIKLGRLINQKFQASVSVYHSFYLNSFKSKADLPLFEKQPRLFINCVGLELEYYFFQGNLVNFSGQLLLGWGFTKYDLDDKDFKSRQVNYFACEPTLAVEFKINNTSLIGLGIGYRPLLTDKQIAYSSSISHGTIPLFKAIPNGLIAQVTIKGFF